MSPATEQSRCDQTELVSLYALHALPSREQGQLEAHLADCPECQRALKALHPLMDCFIDWPTDILRTSEPLWGRLASRIGAESGDESALAGAASWQEPEWESVAPGIFCKLLSNDPDRDRVSMLVRLAPGTAYPPHRHAGEEELFLLGGELWIEDRRLLPGDYHRAEAGTADRRVWSETGCTCLLITSPSDVID